MNGTPWPTVSSRTPRRFAIENGWPPAMFRQASWRTKATPPGPAEAEHAFECDQVDVALERVLGRRVGRLGDRDVHPDRTRELGMDTGGREVQVRGDELTRGDEHARQQMLGPAPLVRRDQVPVAVRVPHRRLETEEAP